MLADLLGAGFVCPAGPNRRVACVQRAV